MSQIDLDDDLIIFTIDSLDDGNNDYHSCSMSDISINDNQPIDLSSSVKLDSKKMSDITDLLNLTEFNDHELPSTNVVDCLRTNNLQNDHDKYEKYQWETEENYLKYGSKQLSPSDYLTRTSLYNRPVAFEKDTRSWARSLLDNFKKTNQNFKSKSSTNHFSYYYPIIKKSSSFNRHVEYIEHLNECNDYPAYLEYLKENRSQLFCTLTDSVDVIDGLIGTVVSSF